MLGNGQEPILYYNQFGAADHVIATEYPLPGLTIPDKIKFGLDPWLSKFLGLESSIARSALAKEWEDIDDPCLISVRAYFHEFVPKSIVLNENEGWLTFVDPKLPHAEAIGAGDIWCVAPPPRIEILQDRLQAFDLQRVKCLQSFCLHFNGLREDLPVIAGGFFRPEEWQRFASYCWEDVQQCQGYHYWRNAVIFWQARSGDLLLLHSSGETAWWDHEENQVHPLASCFADFIRYFVKYIGHRWPFCAWPPPGTDLIYPLMDA